MIARSALALLVAFSLLGAGCARSAKQDEKPTYSITMKTAKRLQKVRAHVEKKDWPAALAEVDEIAEGKYLNPYERAKLWEARSGIHFAMGKGDEVVKDLEQALALNVLPKQENLDATYNLAQAYFMLERFSESADAFAKWAAEAEKQEPSQHYLIASAFAQAKRFAEGLPYAKKAVGLSSKPPEPWLQLLASLHYELEQNAELALVLKKLYETYPKKEHLLQLSATYVALGDDATALATLEPAYARGMLTEENELASLVRLQQRLGAPQKAAGLLEKHLQDGKISKTAQNYDLLAQCWLLAKDGDRAAAAVRAAGEGNVSGEVYYGLAQLHAAGGEWAKARDALASAIQKGGLSAPGDAHLLLGVAHYNTKRKDAALASLTAAKRHGPATAQCADAWIKLVKSGKAGAKADCTVVPTTGAAQAGNE